MFNNGVKVKGLVGGHLLRIYISPTTQHQHTHFCHFQRATTYTMLYLNWESEYVATIVVMQVCLGIKSQQD